ncbi:unnamed protein product, partial [Arabidopsis lyrata]
VKFLRGEYETLCRISCRKSFCVGSNGEDGDCDGEAELAWIRTNARGRNLNRSRAALRQKSIENKVVVVAEVEKNVWPAIKAGKVKPVIHKYLPLPQAAEAHGLMETWMYKTWSLFCWLYVSLIW